MAGRLESRGKNVWRARVFLGRDNDGKRKYWDRTIHGNKTEAQAVLTRMLLAKDTGEVLVDNRISVDEYLDRWLESAVKPRVRAKTYREYKATLHRYVRPKLGARRLTSLRPQDVQDLYTDLQAKGKSARLTHVLLKGALKQAVAWQMLAKNPADYVTPPKREAPRKMHAMTQDEVERFLAAVDSSRWAPFLHLLVGTGLRPSEALALRWRDVDLAAGTLTVRRSVQWDKEKKQHVYNEPKTRSSRRTIPLPYGLTRILAEHMESAAGNGPGDLVFTTRSGKPGGHRTIVQEAFKPALRRAGLDEAIRLYDLRHTHATLLLLVGVHPKVVSERLGHASVAITLDVYSHVMPGMQEQAAEKLDAMMYGEQREKAARVAN